MHLREEQLKKFTDETKFVYGLVPVNFAYGSEQTRFAVHSEVCQQVLDDGKQQSSAKT